MVLLVALSHRKKKVVLENIKHSSDEKDISLDKSELGDNMFFDVDSVSGDKKSANITGINIGSFLNSAANTFKTKHINTGAIFGSPLGAPNFVMNDNKDVSLFSHFSISLEKKWIDPKIIKTQVKMSAKKSFALDINLRITAYDLGNLLERAGRKTCIINRSMETGNRICCVVVSFVSDNDLESAFHMEPIFNGIKLFWARMNLVHCKKCRCFRHSALEYNTPDVIILLSSKELYKKGASEELCFQLTKLYEKKCVPISRSTVFGGKSWAQVVSLSKSSGSAHFGSGLSFFSHGLSGLSGIPSSASTVSSGLSNCLAVLERSLELLADQMFDIMKKLSFVELVPLASKSSVSPLVIPVPLDSVVDSDMAIDDTLASFVLPPLVVADIIADLSSSSSKVLTTKAFVIILGLYAGTLAGVRFKQASVVNALIVLAISSSSYVLLGGNFNENGAGHSASFKKYSDLGLHNVLSAGPISKLKLLIAKIVKALSMGDSLRFVHLAKIWSVLNDVESSKISGLLNICSNSVKVFKQLSVAKKHYHKTKYIESKLAKSVSINRTISKHMDNFVSGKGNMISSILEHPFCKVVLNHLVLDGDLILELAKVKAKVDNIMVDWTRKCKVSELVPDLWSH
ncbi:hypothetical protein G9A89_001715 [Geosiphon pyriformis]|nr:hypothetical protein G9A89_001715 [Geosiphon pyriformis]